MRASASASAKSARHGKLRGIGFSTYIEACGIAPSPGGRLARLRRRLVGIRRGAGQSDRLGRGADRLPPARPGPRDHVRAARVRAARHPDRERQRRARRHRQGAVRHGHLRLALRRGRHVGDRQGARQGRGQGQEGRRPSCWKRPRATSSSRTASSPSPAPTSPRPGATSRSTPISRTSSPARELEPGLKEGAFYDPTNFTFPAGCHICEVEVDPDDRRDRDRGLDRGRRLRHRDQSDDRRGPGARRHRAGRRPGAAGGRGLRQGRPARHRLVHGLLHAARRQLPELQGRHDHDQVAVQSARHQGLRRGRRDRGAGRGDQRHHRRDRHRGD